MTNKIAVIGDKDTVLAFKAVGVDVFDATTAEQAQTQDSYAVVFLAENLAELIPETLAKAKTRAYPAIIPIATGTESSGFGMRGIKSDVEKAIGVDIIFNKEEK